MKIFNVVKQVIFNVDVIEPKTVDDSFDLRVDFVPRYVKVGRQVVGIAWVRQGVVKEVGVLVQEVRVVNVSGELCIVSLTAQTLQY